MKLFTLALLITGAAVFFSGPLQARHSGGGGDTQDYATEYCRYYKTKATFAGRKARTNPGVARYGQRANSLWAQYNTCLKENGGSTTYRAPVY